MKRFLRYLGYYDALIWLLLLIVTSKSCFSVLLYLNDDIVVNLIDSFVSARQQRLLYVGGHLVSYCDLCLFQHRLKLLQLHTYIHLWDDKNRISSLYWCFCSQNIFWWMINKFYKLPIDILCILPEIILQLKYFQK